MPNNGVTPEIVSRFGRVGPIPADMHRMMPQEGVRHSIFPPEVRHNAIWDYHISPEGRHFFSLCAEGSFSQYAHLYEYLPDTGGFRLCFRLDDATVTYDRAIRPSKFHSSFTFMPDGRLIMSSHTTATAPNHPEWMPYQYYNHQWEGFPGSNILIYDPKTNALEDLGIPVPRTSIYGGVYEPESDSFYFGCYMRGHVYKFGLPNRHVRDYGQATEMASFRYIAGPDHNVYFSTKTGALMRVNTKADKIDDLGIQFPVWPHIPNTLFHNQMLFAVIGPDGMMYHTAAYGDTLLRYNFKANTSEDLGHFAPPEFRTVKWGLQAAVGLAFDEYGILWYVFNGDSLCWLVSWDISGNKAPVNHGVIGTPERRVGYPSEIYIRDDVLYASDSNHGFDPPGIFSVPLASVRNGRPGEVCRDAYQYVRVARGAAQFPGDLAKEGERHYLRELLRNEKSAAFYKENPWVFMTPRHFLIKIWKLVPIEESSVKRVWYDDNGDVHAISGPSDPIGAADAVDAAGSAGAEQVFHHIVLREGRVVSVDEEIVGIPDPASREPLSVSPGLSPASGLTLPAWPGRQYIATASAWAPLSGGRTIVGTSDGMLAIVKDGAVYSLGACAAQGSVHQIVSTKDGTAAYGVAGDPNDLGTVFGYDDEKGLTIFGRVFMNDVVSVGGLGASCEPYCLAISGDDRRLVIGARDRMGCVYEYDLSSGICPASMF